MADALVAADVVKSRKAFIEAAEANSRSKNIQPGTYKLRLQMSGESAVTAMLDLKNKIVNGLTIPEGRTAKNIYKLLSDKTKIPVKEFEARGDTRRSAYGEWWFTRDDGKRSSSPSRIPSSDSTRSAKPMRELSS